MENKPVKTINIHDHLRNKLCDLYENDCIFDKFECTFSGDGRYEQLRIMTLFQCCFFSFINISFFFFLVPSWPDLTTITSTSTITRANQILLYKLIRVLSRLSVLVQPRTRWLWLATENETISMLMQSTSIRRFCMHRGIPKRILSPLPRPTTCLFSRKFRTDFWYLLLETCF